MDTVSSSIALHDRSQHQDTRSSAAIEALCTQLVFTGKDLTSSLQAARDIEAVEGHFAAFLGSRAVQAARRLDPRAETTQLAKTALREGLRPLYQHARVWSHATSKPYGYPGDHAILELVYNTTSHPDTRAPWAVPVDRWTVRTELPRAVVARKNTLRCWMEAQLDRTSADAPMRFLSIASGSAREVRELASDRIARSHFTLFDADDRALAFARGHFASRPSAPSVQTVVGDAVRGGASVAALANGAPFDVVYSFGLFDYLPDPLLLRCAKRFLPFLKEGGKFVFCLKDSRYYDAWFYDWFYDWRFIPRTLDDGPELAARLGLSVVETMRVEGGTVGIFVCAKAG